MTKNSAFTINLLTLKYCIKLKSKMAKESAFNPSKLIGIIL